MQEILNKIKSVKLCLMAHPDNQEDSEFEDRISDLIDIEHELQKSSYSEEDLREAFRQGEDNMDWSDTYGWDSKLTEQEWFEQFKKK